jgi:LacI family transcriptional regulator
MNLKLLSQSLGLSQTTVSRALSGYSDVSPATRQRVREAAQALGYQPDPTARRLATGRAEAVGIVDTLGGGALGEAYFAEMLGSLADGLAEARMELLIAAARRHDELETYRRLTGARSVDALVVADARVEDERIRFLQERGFPFVACGRTHHAEPHAWYDVDHQGGARMATERLLALGHQRIALVHAPATPSATAQRRDGYLDALRAAGLAPDPALMREVPASHAGGCDAVRALQALAQPPTALLVEHGRAGAGVLRALMDAGWRPGRGLSLIVLDGVEEELALPVTAVLRPDATQSGRVLARLVLDVLAGLPVESLHHLAQPRFEAGATALPAPQREAVGSC